MSITISEYLQGRQHNSQLLTKLAETVLDPIIDAFNADQDREISVEWSMSAKYQSITINVEMDDDDYLTKEAVDLLNDSQFSEELSEWFGVEVDIDDIRDDRYICIDLGM